MRRSILIVICCCLLKLLCAQRPLELQFDKNAYVLGEKLWFKAHLPPQNDLANVLRIELVAPDGQRLVSKKLAIDKGIATGHIPISLDWSEGWYQFRAYTIWNPVLEVKHISVAQLAIYDDFKERNSNPPDPESLADLQKDQQALPAMIKLNRDIHKRRDKVTLTVELDETGGQTLSGDLAISVVPKEEFEYTLALTRPHWKQVYASSSETQMAEQQNQCYAVVEEKDRSALLAAGVYYPSNNQTQWQSVNEMGVFSFDCPEFGELQAQVIGMYRESSIVQTRPIGVQNLDFSSFLDIPGLNTSPLPYNSMIEQGLKQSRQRKKYSEIFGLGLAAKKSEKLELQSDLIPDKSYRISDFSNMTDLTEFLREVIPTVRVRERKGLTTLRLFDENKLFTQSDPVFLVNGWIHYDQKAVLNIPIQNITQVDIFRISTTLSTQFGALGKHGVISVHTKNKKDVFGLSTAGNVLSVQGIEAPEAFPKSIGLNTRLPDFRSLVYWNPEVSMTNGRATLDFQHSDDLGQFYILVQGLTNSGEKLFGRTAYTVE